MNTGCLYIYSCHLQFLSLTFFVVFSAQVLLGLFLIILLFFRAAVNGIVFLISSSDSSLLVYRSTTDFYMLILCPAALLNLFISSNFFCLESLRFSTYKMISSENKDNFTYFFLS